MSLCLRAAADFLSIPDTADDGAELLTIVFAVFRLAILAKQDPASNVRSRAEDGAIEALWAKIWPDWYRLVSLSLDANSINTVRPKFSLSPCLSLIRRIRLCKQ